MSTITSVQPLRAVEGGRVTIHGTAFPVDNLLTIAVGEAAARVTFASSSRLVVLIPEELEGGRTPIKIPGAPGETAYVSIGARWATGLHQVDNPVFDAEGNLFVTYSGSRGQEAPVSIFRVTRNGTREPFASGLVNATSMAVGPDGNLYVSSRFEGAVYRVDDAGSHEQVASDLGVACGIAFDEDGWMYVGDRSGTIFRLRDGRAAAFATIPPSVAAFHLAMSAEQELFVTAPTLNAYDYVYRIDRRGAVRTMPSPLGRPQGLVFAPDGTLHVVDALAGASGVYRFTEPDAAPQLVLSGAVLVGVAFGPQGEVVVTSNETAYRFD
ncbi:MAG: IPT/TIG domain-containing protein [Acidobacteria bacterium]|nr:IPT/TIG domain-containing protein [Acidobacteriota bacterium]